jgi:hypothetical protein
MDRILDAILKLLPGPILGVVLAIAVAFFGVHYWRGFRDYGDTLRDRTFLSISILLAAALCLYLVNRAPSAPSSRSLLVLVPFFENDERDQLRTAFTVQLEQVLSRAGYSRAVHALPVSIVEHASAVQTAKRYGALATVFQPVVIRDKESVKLCFHIAFAASDSSKPYAMLPVELPAKTLDEIANSLLAAEASTAAPEQRNPVLSRLDALEKQLGEIRANFEASSGSPRSSKAPYPYRRRYAVVVGVNELATVGFSLKYAVSDARAFSNVLDRYGFDRTLLLGSAATKANVTEALVRLRQLTTDQDLVLFYYAGNSIAETLSPQTKRTLLLLLADSKPAQHTSALTIDELADALRAIPARHKLAVLDGCHGTTGLTEVASAIGISPGKPDEPVLQFFSGSSDEQYGMESAELGGGAFTQALIRVLDRALEAGDGRGLWMHDVVAATGTLMRAQPNVRQNPKLVTVSGHGEVYWSRTRESR